MNCQSGSHHTGKAGSVEEERLGWELKKKVPRLNPVWMAGVGLGDERGRHSGSWTDKEADV